ncbi:hypothetical protein COCCADRAFT_35644 [Bipolaris zeicola 26-R-13]|uniref:Uncharacterized protein n=1 Tax=Cochliobolus carbonum (strain 26-R-13) TaxID=930089 RepID=W6YGQ2_COCC2|nr:uncharacterized protein COCCADRAFT_35644 [Bipolaris zeicola 26-R-13]EUC34709.1 hypothetical protein COCCADRAFT_35644 [Bipolaris zeicola 26-R-13]
MGIANPSVDPANVVQSLVYILSGVFDATRDLYRTLSLKEQREYEQSLRSYSRRAEYVSDERLGSEEAIMTDKATMVRQFEIGYHAMGTEFAMGDVTAQTELQWQIIALQSVLVSTAIYGPVSSDSAAHQLSNINAASRAAAARSIEILVALQDRQMDERPVTPRSMHSVTTTRSSPHHAPSHVASHVTSHSTSHAPSHAPSHHSSYAPSVTPSQSISCVRPTTVVVAPSQAPSKVPSKVPSKAPSKAPSQAPSKVPSQAPSKVPSQAPSRAPSKAPSKAPSHAASQAPSRVLVLPQPPIGANSTTTVTVKHDEPVHVRTNSPINTTILDWQSKVEPASSVTESTSTIVPSHPGHLYCQYAYDLQRDPTQPLHPTLLTTRDARCPHCAGSLHLSPGKAWEISKWAGDTERTFQVSNRFVVKCHRDGPDAQYCCVICSKYSDSDTVCGDVKALVKHLSDEHEVRELKHEEDIVEVIEQVMVVGKRDSGVGYTGGAASRGSRSRRSASVVSGKGRRRKSLGVLEREVDVFDVRSGRR